MKFLPKQKDQFREDVKVAIDSLFLISSRAGLDQFDEELMLEVVRLDRLVSNVKRTILHALTNDDEVSPTVIDPQTALIQEEYEESI